MRSASLRERLETLMANSENKESCKELPSDLQKFSEPRLA